jgi:hypothetical protein
MLYRNTFPEFLEAISIGPDPSFLEKNTTFCEFVSAFPQEVELMYEWKFVKKSSNPLNALRNFTKRFIIYGPDLDVQTLQFFVKRFNVFPSYYTDMIKEELGSAFEIAKTYNQTQLQNSTQYFITNYTKINEDKNFLRRLASMLNSCKRPCNYFKPMSSSIGTLGDFGRAMSDSASVLGAAGSELLHAPVNIGTNIYNKIKPMVRTEFNKLKILTQNLYQDGVKPFFSKEDRERVKNNLQQGKSPDMAFSRLPLTGDTHSYFSAVQVHTEIQSKIQQNLGDCYRMYEYNQRFNPYDPLMNSAYAKRKYMGLKNDQTKSLVDIFGGLAPAQYASETTYKNTLDVPKGPELLKYEDAKVAPKYDTYDGPSKGAEQVVTGGKAVSPVVATGMEPQAGAGLENVPSNGKVYEFDYGEVKITAYGYAEDECPDSGSEIGLGNSGNMIIPLKTIAVAPETLPKTKKNPIGTDMVKRGDVLIMTITDKQGNTWTERRQVGDSSGAGLLKKGGNYKFLIDEFLPTKKGSKIAGRAKELKIKIQVADTKEPLATWNPQEASQFAPMFICRTDWERVKLRGPAASSGFVKANMDNEYRQYCKWNPSDPVKQKIIDTKGC